MQQKGIPAQHSHEIVGLLAGIIEPAFEISFQILSSCAVLYSTVVIEAAYPPGARCHLPYSVRFHRYQETEDLVYGCAWVCTRASCVVLFVIILMLNRTTY